MNETMKGKVRAAVEHAAIYEGKDMHANAGHIRSKLSPGTWTVYIWKPIDKNFWTSYECRHGDYWARLYDYGIFEWTYYIVYSH